MTPTGLLMEGHYTHLPWKPEIHFHADIYGDGGLVFHRWFKAPFLHYLNGLIV